MVQVICSTQVMCNFEVLLLCLSFSTVCYFILYTLHLVVNIVLTLLHDICLMASPTGFFAD